MKILKAMYLRVSNLPSDEAVELPEDLTAEKMVTVVTAFFKASNNVIETVVQDLLAKVRCTHFIRARMVEYSITDLSLFAMSFVCPLASQALRLARTVTWLRHPAALSVLIPGCRKYRCVSCRPFQGENLADPETSMKMATAIQERSGPATDEAIKRFNLDSSVSPALEPV